MMTYLLSPLRRYVQDGMRERWGRSQITAQLTSIALQGPRRRA